MMIDSSTLWVFAIFAVIGFIFGAILTAFGITTKIAMLVGAIALPLAVILMIMLLFLIYA